MEKRWRNFPEGRRWLYLLLLLPMPGMFVGLYRAYDDFVHPTQVGWSTHGWYDELADVCVVSVVEIACIAYDRRRLRQDRGIGPRTSKRWREKVELRWVLYAIAIRLMINVPLSVYTTFQAMKSPFGAPWGPKFWDNFSSDSLFGAAIAVAMIFFDRRWIRREGWIEAGLCRICGYDLRATPERCPECGTAAVAVSAAMMPTPNEELEVGTPPDSERHRESGTTA